MPLRRWVLMMQLSMSWGGVKVKQSAKKGLVDGSSGH